MIYSKQWFFIIMTFMLMIIMFACGRGHRNNTVIDDSSTVLSNSGVDVRVFDQTGKAIVNPSTNFRVDVTQTGKTRRVVVALKEEMSINANYLEVKFDASKEHPVDIQCGSALAKQQPIVYTGSPEAGVVICAQVIPSEKVVEAKGSLLELELSPGQHQVREVSDLYQDPIKDPLLLDSYVDNFVNGKIYWTFKLRGDAYVNQVFDFVDFGIVGGVYTRKVTDNPAIEPSDSNNNGKIDFEDFGLIGSSFGKGIGGLKIYRDDNPDPTTFLGILNTGSGIKSDFTIDKSANKKLANGFRQYWYTCGGTGRFIKIVLIDNKGIVLSNHKQIVDTGMANAWTVAGHDGRNSKCSPVEGPVTNVLKWIFSAFVNLDSSPVVDANGIVYVCNNNSLYAINTNGTLLWDFAANSTIFGPPAIATDGSIYFGSKDDNLYSLNPNGTLNWKQNIDSPYMFSSPVIDSKGTVYICTHDKLLAINSDGSIAWTYNVSFIDNRIPAIGSDNSIYVASSDKLYAISTTGQLKWSYKPLNIISTSPAIGTNGSIYFGGGDFKLYAVSSEGTLNWTYDAEDYLEYSPAIGKDGTILFGCNNKNLYALNPNGSTKWIYKTDVSINSSPSVDSKGNVFFGSSDDNLYSVSSTGQLNWSYQAGGSIYSTPVIGVKNTIYFSCNNNQLYAIGASNMKSDLYSPTEVNASDGSFNDRIQITWTKPTTGVVPEGYKIYRSVVPNGTYELIDSIGDAVTYDDFNAPYSSVYYYKVSSIWSNFESVLSKEDSGKKLNGNIWSSFGYDSTNNRRSPYIGPSSNQLKYNTATQNYLGPIGVAIGSDGTYYLPVQNRGIMAYRPIEGLIWAYYTENLVYSTPALDNDGNIYFGCLDKKVYALNKSGSLMWSFTTGGEIYSSPIIGTDRTVYIGSNDNNLYAINPNGTLKWMFKTNGKVTSSPAINSEGTIYVGSYDKKLYAINKDGSLKWSFTTGSIINFSSPAIGEDGTIFIGSSDKNLYAINPDGTQKWAFTTGDCIESSPAVSSKGCIYVGSWDGKLYAINETGHQYWSIQTGNDITSSPVIDAYGNIIVGSWDGRLYSFTPQGNPLWTYKVGSKIDSSPVIDAEGSVLIGDKNGSLNIIGPGDGKSGLIPPTNIKATNGTEDGVIAITWSEPSSSPMPEGYYIYRALEENGIYQYIGYSYINSYFNPIPRYNDFTGESGKNYYYKIKSYNSDSGYNDSDFSKPVVGSMK